jgi:hypothetical protein
MALSGGTLITGNGCEADEVFQKCLGVVVEVRPETAPYPIGVVWIQRCPEHGGQRAVCSETWWYATDECWQVGQLY